MAQADKGMDNLSDEDFEKELDRLIAEEDNAKNNE